MGGKKSEIFRLAFHFKILVLDNLSYIWAVNKLCKSKRKGGIDTNFCVTRGKEKKILYHFFVGEKDTVAYFCAHFEEQLKIYKKQVGFDL